MVNAGSITSITGSLADLLTAYGSNGITGLGNEAITVSDTTSLAASDLNSLDSKTSGLITLDTTLATLTGTVAELNTAYGSINKRKIYRESIRTHFVVFHFYHF